MILRALFILVTLVEVFVVATPYFVGRYAEQAARSWVQDSPLHPAGYIANIEQYERGWWKSRIIWSLQFSPAVFGEEDNDVLPALLAQTNKPLRVVTEIEHGPLLSLDGVTFGWVQLRGYLDNFSIPVTERRFDERLPADTFLGFEGTIDLWGNQRVTGGIPVLQQRLVGSSPLQLDFGGLSFEVNSSYIEKTVAFNCRVPRLSIRQNQGPVLSVSGIHWSGSGEFAEGWNWVGSSRFIMEEMQVVSEPSNRVVIQNAQMIGDSRLDVDNTITAQGLYKIAKVAVNDDQFTGFEMALLFERISLDAIQKYMNMANQIALDSEDPLQLQMEFSALFQHLLPEILPRSPAISLSSLGFKWNDRNFSFKGQARFNGNDFAKPAHFYDPNFWLKRLNVIASLQVDKDLAEEVAEFIFNDQISENLAEDSRVNKEQIRHMASAQADSTLALLTRQRQLISTPRGYKANFVLESGQARLNGELVSLLQ